MFPWPLCLAEESAGLDEDMLRICVYNAYTTCSMWSYQVGVEKKREADDWIYLDSMSNVNICGPEHKPIIDESYEEDENSPCINGVGEMRQDVVASGEIKRMITDAEGRNIIISMKNVKVVEGMDKILNSLGKMIENGWKCDMLNMKMLTPGGEEIPMEFHESFLRIKSRKLDKREEAEIEEVEAKKQQ